MHLTNYAINKDAEEFVFNDDAKVDNVGHKRSMSAVLKQMDKENGGQGTENGVIYQRLWSQIKDVVVKTMIAG